MNVAKNVKINVAYFQTLYEDYNKVTETGQDCFTRSNRVIGIGADFKF